MMEETVLKVCVVVLTALATCGCQAPMRRVEAAVAPVPAVFEFRYPDPGREAIDPYCELIATLRSCSVQLCIENAIHCPGKLTREYMLCAEPGDLDGDGDVDLKDYWLMQQNWTGPMEDWNVDTLERGIQTGRDAKEGRR